MADKIEAEPRTASEDAHFSNSTPPEDAHITKTHLDQNDEREATELGEYAAHGTAPQAQPDAPTASDNGSSIRRNHLRRQKPRWNDGIKKFWRNQIQVSVPHNACRDHLGEFFFLQYSVAAKLRWILPCSGANSLHFGKTLKNAVQLYSRRRQFRQVVRAVL